MEAILAMDQNNGLSKEGIIPWTSKKDLQFFYKKTKNNVVIMGKNTYFSLPDNVRPLKNRLNIVLTNHPNLFLNEDKTNVTTDVIFTNNINIHASILNNRETYCRLYPALSRDFKIYIIGGKQIYEHFIPLCETIWVTRIKKSFSCDLIFDINLENRFKEVLVEEDEEMKISTFKSTFKKG
jgi:dihydrofolate reductase